jgi:hypothetical protein
MDKPSRQAGNAHGGIKKMKKNEKKPSSKVGNGHGGIQKHEKNMEKKHLAARQAMRMVVCRLAAVRTVPESHACFLLFLFFYYYFKAAVKTVLASHACSLPAGRALRCVWRWCGFLC